LDGNQSKKKFSSTPTAVEDTVSGAVAGVAGKVGIFPMDLVRKRLQIQGPTRTQYVISNIPVHPSNVLRCIFEIVRNEGVFGLYKGITPALMKAAPASAVTFLVYGWSCDVLERRKMNEED
jgi:solute carrier family 25 thiamine pyrophosphate transporter 19